jgi:DNA helicase II / ATP-dependent DNA helicase PcrA
MSTFIPSQQQADFLNWVSEGSGSCILEAVAGAGKTTTIIEAIERTQGGVLILAYNKKIAEEIKAKLQQRDIDWKTAEASTVHAAGLRGYRKAFPSFKTDGYKVANLIERAAKATSFGNPYRLFAEIIAKLVSLAKQRALGIVGSIDDRSAWYEIADHFDVAFDDDRAFSRLAEIIECSIEILKESNEQTSIIDFDDMVYLPVFHKVRFWGYEWIFVDEAQDTNPARRALVRALLAPGGRVVAVGDRHQAIYGFTGADADSLDLIRKDFAACELPLTTTYRCPKAVVSFAQQWVSHIEAHEDAPEGIVRQITGDQLLEQNNLTRGTAILCRNTKPLVKLAFYLIRNRVPCRVEGRDIGVSLIKLATKWGRVTTLDELEHALDVYLEREKTKLLAKKEELKAQAVEDRVDTLRVIIDDCRGNGLDRPDDVVAAIEKLFGDDIANLLVLSTGHKAKGREWETVYILDFKKTIPSKYARQQWQLDQEFNLAYVMVTRSQNELILIED